MLKLKRSPKGSVTLRNFLSNLSLNAVARQVAGELHSVTWVVSQFFVARSVARGRTQFYSSQRIAATGDTTAQCVFPSATFLAILRHLNKGTCDTSHFSFRGALGTQVLPRPSLIRPIILQVAEIALQCNTHPWQLATLHFQALREELLRILRSVTGPS